MKNKTKVLVVSIFVAIIVVILAIHFMRKDTINSVVESKIDTENETDNTSDLNNDTEKESFDIQTDNTDIDSEQTQESISETTQPETKYYSIKSNTEIDPSKPMVALTFDDGPAGDKTNTILDVLSQYNARATFFVIGSKLDEYSDIIKRATSLKCEIGNHTMTHSRISNIDDETIKSEISDSSDRIKELTGQEYVICRPPYGDIDNDTMAKIGVPVILWSIDTLDWKTKNVSMTVQTIMEKVKDGDIILMHDIHQESVDAAVIIIPWLVEQGYQLVTVSELGQYKRGGLFSGVKYGAIR